MLTARSGATTILSSNEDRAACLRTLTVQGALHHALCILRRPSHVLLKDVYSFPYVHYDGGTSTASFRVHRSDLGIHSFGFSKRATFAER